MKKMKPDFKCPVCEMGVFIKENPESRGQWRAKCPWCGLKTDWAGSREGAAKEWEKVLEYWAGRRAPAGKEDKNE